jgi:hypothetical protein
MSADIAKAAPSVGTDSSAASDKAGSPQAPARKYRAMGRIEHMLLDEGRKSSPTDLRPSPATPPYHRKCQMFLSTTTARDTPALKLGCLGPSATCLASLAPLAQIQCELLRLLARL